LSISLLDLEADYLTKKDKNNYIIRKTNGNAGGFVHPLGLSGKPDPDFKKYTSLMNEAYSKLEMEKKHTQEEKNKILEETLTQYNEIKELERQSPSLRLKN